MGSTRREISPNGERPAAGAVSFDNVGISPQQELATVSIAAYGENTVGRFLLCEGLRHGLPYGKYPKLQILTIKDLFAGKKPNLGTALPEADSGCSP